MLLLLIILKRLMKHVENLWETTLLFFYEAKK